MALNVIAQTPTAVSYSSAATVAATFGSTMTNPSLIVLLLTQDFGGSTPTCSDNKNAGNYTIDSSLTNSITATGGVYIASKQNTQTAAATVTCTFTSSNGFLRVFEVTGAATSSALDVQNTAFSTKGVASLSVTTTQSNDSIFGVLVSTYAGVPPDAGYTTAFGSTAVFTYFHMGESRANAGSAGGNTITMNDAFDVNGPAFMFAMAAYKTANPVVATPGTSLLLQFP